MVILWTDALIFLLVSIVACFIVLVRGKAHFQRPLRQIADNTTGVVSLVFLLFFVAVGLLDSVHFHANKENSAEIISVLDLMAAPLREQSEKTYSAPFAATLYNKEMLESPDGSRQWDYPRLVYGGAHLVNPKQDLPTDVALKALTGLAQGTLLAILLFVVGAIGSHLTKKKYPRNKTTQAISVTVFGLVTGVYLLVYLSGYYHVFGTDKVGEDVFYQAIKSVRTGLVIGTLTTLVMLPMALLFGLLAGYFQGWADDVIQYVYTTLNSIPSVLLIAAAILMVQVHIANHEQEFANVLVRADIRLLFLCLILGVTNWTGLCRLLRAETLKLREMEYVQAAQALGVKSGLILIRHILPNVMHIVLISVVLDFSALVLAEAVLSYINIGVDPTTYSWGNMINGARLEMAREPMVWWSLAAAFSFMFVLVLSANLFADAVQSAFDPKRDR